MTVILVEGPDGAGKTTLIEKLEKSYNLPRMPRFAGTHGPMDNLYDRVYQDSLTRKDQECSIYDRHPLISEYIYSFALDRQITPAFLWPSARAMRHSLAHDSLLILCLPPISMVRYNVNNSEQMKGVADKIEMIYQQYQMLRITWPGKFITYDYTKTPVPASPIELHMTEWNRNR